MTSYLDILGLAVSPATNPLVIDLLRSLEDDRPPSPAVMSAFHMDDPAMMGFLRDLVVDGLCSSETLESALEDHSVITTLIGRYAPSAGSS